MHELAYVGILVNNENETIKQMVSVTSSITGYYCGCQKSTSRKNNLLNFNNIFLLKSSVCWWALIQKCSHDVFPNCFTVRSEERSVNIKSFMDTVLVYLVELNWSENNNNNKKLYILEPRHSNFSDNRCSKSQKFFWCREPQGWPWGKYSEALTETKLTNLFLKGWVISKETQNGFSLNH